VLCRVPQAHGRGQNPHGTAFAVRILPGRKTKGAQRIFAQQRPLPCAVGKGNARHRSLSCATCDAWQRKGVDGYPRRDGVTRSLPCAAHKYSQHIKIKKQKKQGRMGPASTRPLPHRRRPPVLRSPRQQRHHHHHTPAAPLSPPPPHIGNSTGSSGHQELGPPRE
jgi:hypothetical protein